MLRTVPSLVLFFLITSTVLRAQVGAIDPTFNPDDQGKGFGDLFNSQIYASALQPDGKIIVAGLFSVYNGTPIPKIARINADGTLDPSFKFDKSSTIDIGNTNTIILLPDNKILLGGYHGVIRLNNDGTLDPTFAPVLGTDKRVFAMIRQNDGKILIAGFFTKVNNVDRNHMARLNADGTPDESFNPGTGTDDGAAVVSFGLTADSKILVGGSFTSFNGVNRNRILRLNSNGSVDLTFDPGTGVTNVGGPIVRCIKVLPSGKVLLAGMVYTYNGQAVNFIFRIEANGALDNTFTSTGGAFEIRTISMDANNKILISGQYIERLNENGSADNTFHRSKTTTFAMTHQYLPGGKILVAGLFNKIDATGQNFIVVLKSDGTVDTEWNPGTGANGGAVASITPYQNQYLISGGFTHYNGFPANGMAMIDEDGAASSFFAQGAGDGADLSVNAVAVDNNNLIIIGGLFTKWNNVTRQKIARIDPQGSLDAAYNDGVGFGAADGVSVATIAVQPDNKALVGGFFTSFDGTTRTNMLRLDANGNLDAAFNPHFSDGIVKIVLQSDNKIIVGGYFTSVNGAAQNRLVRLNTDGSTDNTFNIGTGANSGIRAVAIQPDGKILVGGFFSSFNGVTRNIVRLNTNGTIDETFNPGVGIQGNSGTSLDIRSITVDADGKILIAGSFDRYQNVAASHLVRVNADGSIDATFDTTTGPDDYVYATRIVDDRKVLIGGEFTSLSGGGKNYIARLLVACAAPETASTPTLSATRTEKCKNEGAITISVTSGTLHTLTKWKWYTGGCNGMLVGTGTSLTVNPSVTTTYYVREEGGCVTAGECVSITINVYEIPTMTFNSLVDRCDAGTVVLSVNAGDAAVKWTNAQNEEVGTGSTFTTQPIEVGGQVLFYAQATKNGCSSTKATLFGRANVKPKILTHRDDERCGPGTTVVNATSDIGTIKWYAESTGGNPIGTGTSLTMFPTTTTTYYAAAEEGSCSSDRVAVTATITTIPQFTVSGVSTSTLTVTVTNIANTEDLIYLWRDCNTLTSQANGTSASFTPTKSDTYTVDVTNGQCKTGSICTQAIVGVDPGTVTGLGDELPASMFYPNPSNGSITIDLSELRSPVNLLIMDVLGRQVYSSQQVTTGTTLVELQGKGLYIVSVDEGGVIRKGKVIVR